MSLAGKSVLLVDDDPELRVLLRRILEGAGCRVEEAGGVRDAVDRLSKSLPDLITLDLNMPELDGFAFLQIRQKNPKMAAIPVLVLSGRNDKESVLQAMAVGANHYVVKPLKSVTVLQKIRKIFSNTADTVYEFPLWEAPDLDVQLPGTLEGLNAEGALLRTPVRLERDIPVRITVLSAPSPAIAILHAVAPNRLAAIDEGSYLQRVKLKGLTSEQEKLIEAWMRSWR